MFAARSKTATYIRLISTQQNTKIYEEELFLLKINLVDICFKIIKNSYHKNSTVAWIKYIISRFVDFIIDKIANHVYHMWLQAISSRGLSSSDSLLIIASFVMFYIIRNFASSFPHYLSKKETKAKMVKYHLWWKYLMIYHYLRNN